MVSIPFYLFFHCQWIVCISILHEVEHFTTNIQGIQSSNYSNSKANWHILLITAYDENNVFQLQSSTVDRADISICQPTQQALSKD